MKKPKPETRILGIDDAPFERGDGCTEIIASLFRGKKSLEAVLSAEVEIDGLDSTEKIIGMVKGSKFYPQIQAVLLDGITFGGFNIVDMERMASELDVPVIAVTRGRPDKESIYEAVENLENSEERSFLVKKAGRVYSKETGNGKLYFQFKGSSEKEARQILELAIDESILPEPVRISHIIATGVKTGESSGDA
ncbi:MAG: DUF99 family protein [Candidatus Nanohaloarchaeota archaeon QJJ-9]|nr:DUF99 family protein [Candidatus Nanohaloarchaeota archaeon QJJ-9]